jgi:hypothetical protein
MRGIETGQFVAGRGYSFTDEKTGEKIEGGTFWLAHFDDEGAREDGELGARLESYGCKRAVFDAMAQGGVEFGTLLEVDAELRPGSKKPRALAVRRVQQ